MNLLSVRKRFVEFTGRYDLIVDTDSFKDAGADWYIQEGQKWLDRQFTMGSSYARHYSRLSAAQWFAPIPECRAIQEVWMGNSTGRKWQLKKADPIDLAHMRHKDPARLTPDALGVNCSPVWQQYSPIFARTVPEDFKTLTFDVFFNTIYEDTLKSSYDYNALVFMPPSSEELELEVHGLFYQPKLVRDRDRNIWTERFEFILVTAACRHLEVTYRNQAGVNDYTTEIMAQLVPIEFDHVEQEVAEAYEIRG